MKTGLCDIPSAPHLKCVMCVGGDIIKLLFSVFWWILKALWNAKQPQPIMIEVVFQTINIHKD